MRLILSRKGYDSSSGGCPSPIFPGGKLCSLPIPSEDDLTLQDIRLQGISLGAVVAQLVGEPGRATSGAHLDPDLAAAARTRLPGWQPCFGQTGSAQAHLEKQGVGVGHLFLFFGWFREVEAFEGRWRYGRTAPDIHCLFGWLQIGSTYRLDRGDDPPAWSRAHPHVQHADRYRSSRSSNVLYVASKLLDVPGCAGELPGAGVFPCYSPDLRLTAPGRSRSVWQLPACFEPRPGAPSLSFHGSAKRWSREGDRVLLRSAGRGQEFVLDCDHYPGVFDWLAEVFSAEFR